MLNLDQTHLMKTLFNYSPLLSTILTFLRTKGAYATVMLKLLHKVNLFIKLIKHVHVMLSL